jgi:hypothetical protein
MISYRKLGRKICFAIDCVRIINNIILPFQTIIMDDKILKSGRRKFIKVTAALGFAILPNTMCAFDKSQDEGIHIIGPKKGFSPQVGTMASMLNWMRMVVLDSVKDLTAEQLDYLHDPQSNSIGAMLMHLAAIEVYYQANTFEGRQDLNAKEKLMWGAAAALGKEGRTKIRGNNLDYYLNILNETRENTLAEFRKRDDEWLMAIDSNGFSGQPTNNYCKWFHVCEHESNHNGQIKYIKSRLPGASGVSD